MLIISIQYVIVFFHLINLIKKQVWNLFENNCKNYYIKQIIWVFLTLFLNYNTRSIPTAAELLIENWICFQFYHTSVYCFMVNKKIICRYEDNFLINLFILKKSSYIWEVILYHKILLSSYKSSLFLCFLLQNTRVIINAVTFLNTSMEPYWKNFNFNI